MANWKISDLDPIDPNETGQTEVSSGGQSWRGNLSAWVRGALLSGLSTATNAAIAATDSVLVALGKLQAQITGHISNTTSAHGMTTPGAAIVQAATVVDQRAALGLANHQLVVVDSLGGVGITTSGSNAEIRQFGAVFHAGGTCTFTLTADFNYLGEINATMAGNEGSSIEQIKVILGRRDYSGAPHLSAVANVVGAAGYANITFSDVGDVRTWTITIGHALGAGNLHWMIDTKTSNANFVIT